MPMLTLGTGVGGGVVLGANCGGARHCGRAGASRFIGCAPWCGKRGCLKHYAATAALVRRAQTDGETQLNGRVIFDPAANEVILAC
ncbi:MAG: ROK family protein [Christensenellales bacterium]